MQFTVAFKHFRNDGRLKASFTKCHLQLFSDYFEYLDTIQSMIEFGGHTATGDVLNFIQTRITRPDVENVVVVLTDGNSNYGSDVGTASINLRSQGVKIVSIGVGNGVDMSELITIAGDPSSVYTVTDFDNLDSILNDTVFEICCKFLLLLVYVSPFASLCDLIRTVLIFIFLYLIFQYMLFFTAFTIYSWNCCLSVH